MSLSDDERRIRQRLRDDYQHYASKCLKIRTKAGHIEPFIFNEAQCFLHSQLEQQRSETGKVRALVLKGRQQGISTYVGGRYYHRATHSRGVRVFILTHEQEATNNLFGMVDRYHDKCPDPVRPHTGASNAKELYFNELESGYAVGTAGAKAVGRSQTVQLFHGSEVAFWPNAADHFAGVVQAVPDLPGTEIILESTANGVGGEFHERWQQAEAGVGDYIPIFIPWFWQSEYQRGVGPDFDLTDEEAEYKRLYDLSNEQIAWRRNKISELKDPLLFKQEYPANAQEAFQLTGHDSYIKPADVLRARKATCEAVGPLVMGVDPARFGDDGFSIARRQGRVVQEIKKRHKLDNVEGANWVRSEIDQHSPDRVFVDVGGQGAGVVDILRSWGAPYSEIVVPVNFGSAPYEPMRILPDGTKEPGPLNRRAEMWGKSNEWLQDPGGADIPDKDSLQADACGPGFSYDINQRLKLESKEHMRSRGVRSPDDWDAVVLTFAEPVEVRTSRPKPKRVIGGAQGWMG